MFYSLTYLNNTSTVLNAVTAISHYTVVPTGRITCMSCPSVWLAVCLLWAPNSKTKRRRKTKKRCKQSWWQK